MNNIILKLITVTFLILFTFILNCCSKNISKTNIDISPNKGILITKIHSNIDTIRVIISRNPKDILRLQSIEIKTWETVKYLEKDPNDISGTKKTKFKIIKDLLKVVPLNSGKAYISKIYPVKYRGFYKLEPYYFNIEPGTITYIGDLCIDIYIERGLAHIKIIDKEDETIAEAKQKYPWIFKKYPYKKSIPEITIETVVGFEEVEELKDMKEKMKKEKDNLE
jgi:hypothetical protein